MTEKRARISTARSLRNNIVAYPFFCYHIIMATDIQEGKIKSSEEEIKELERKLAEKKQEMAAGATAPAEEKELFREVMREHAAEMKQPTMPAGEPLISALKPTPAPVPPPGAQDAQKQQAREEELKALVEFALSHTIQRAVEKAQAESPYLLDALHDRLADEYYEKMVALRKLKPL